MLSEIKGVFYRSKSESWWFEGSNGIHYAISNDRPYETGLWLRPGYHDNTRGSIVIGSNQIVRVKTCRR